MTIISRNELKPRFNTGAYPTQDDFCNVFDSYFHKTDKIPAASVDGINELLNSNNISLLKEVQKIVDSYHAVDYVEQNLLNVVLTPFKHGLSIHKLSEDTEVGFADMSGQIGSVKLIVENVGDTEITLTIEENASLIVFADTDSIALAKGCFVEIILTGYGDYQTLCYRISKAKENLDYVKGKIDSIYHEFSADPNGTGTWYTWLTTPHNYDTKDHTDETGEWFFNGINKQTLQTIEIGEHIFTRQNFMFKYRSDKDDGYANVTQAQIDAAFAPTPVKIAETYDQSRYINGAYTVCDGVVYDAVNTGTFYNNSTDRDEIEPFKIPTVGDWVQIMSMADDTSYQGILQFMGVKPAKVDESGAIIENGGDEELPYPYDHIWENNTDKWDASGLHLTPSARRYNAGNEYGAGNFYAYRKSVGLRAANEDGTLSPFLVALNINAGKNGEAVALHTQDYGSTYHLASVRLCRRKTSQELGYQLYADSVNDKVIVTKWNDAAPIVNKIVLEPIPIGRLRGVCVRHLNKSKTLVLASLSSLQSKVDLTNTGGGRWYGFDNY